MNTVDLLLLNFCRKFELLYGKEHCTPNLHLHLHIKDCLLDYGPSHSFWCFAFERFNGILGSFHTNKKAVEVQIMRKFTNTQRLRNNISLANPAILSVLPSDRLLDHHSQPVKEFNVFDAVKMSVNPINTLPLGSFSIDYQSEHVRLLPPLHEDVLNFNHQKALEVLYQQLYPQSTLRSTPFFIRSGRASLYGQIVGSTMNSSSCNSSSVISAYWPRKGQNLSTIDYAARMSIGQVQFFCQHKVKLLQTNTMEKDIEHIFAFVLWKEKHHIEDFFGISATVCLNASESESPCCFIPIQRINSICAQSVMEWNISGITETVFIAIPTPFKYVS